MELESLVVPQADMATEAGRLIERLPVLWSAASLEERRKLLLTMLEAVYVDTKGERRIVAVKPKAPFRPIFQVATMKEGSGIVLVHESKEEAENADQPPPGGHEADDDSCLWWRRGRVHPEPSIVEMGLYPVAA